MWLEELRKTMDIRIAGHRTYSNKKKINTRKTQQDELNTT
jgi:hypothetical protein